MIQPKELIQDTAKEYMYSKESLLPILQKIIAKNKYVTDSDIIEIANTLDISAAEIYGTASFYSYLDTEERGENVIRVCKSIVAVMKGKDKIIETIQDMLHIKVGQTTHDNKFTLLETNDIGWSDKEPSMLINDKVYTDLTPKKVTEIIKSYQKN